MAAAAHNHDRWHHQESAGDEKRHPHDIKYNKTHGPPGASRPPQNLDTETRVQVKCGPLINYRGMGSNDRGSTWLGSILIVAIPGSVTPILRLQSSGSVDIEDIHTQEDGSEPLTNGHASSGTRKASANQTIEGRLLFSDPRNAFWRFDVVIPILERETRYDYSIDALSLTPTNPPRSRSQWTFIVPAAAASMRMMFHSCNGFSVGTDEEQWAGPVLWKDVIRFHEQKPFHVMIGGGDQIYNDGVRVGEGPLRPWTNIANPKRRRDYPFNEDLRAACDKYYCDNYLEWYSTEPFATANAQIPQINIWDDHDIIDGFGSYTDHFMRCAVFRGIGGVALKYYSLFQHHCPPPRSTFTTDDPQTIQINGANGCPPDPVQLKDTFVLEESLAPCFIAGRSPGPYVEECSRSMYAQLGARIAFMGLDARTERTRHQVNHPGTYEHVFARVGSELEANRSITHLIVLLGIPIAYPRLTWLENIIGSPLMAPLRLLNKRFGVAGSLFNHFDGQVDLLDDLDDHYTARLHKKERRWLIHRLQQLSHEHSVRITILGGDVHLAALGRFYANPKLKIAAAYDARYMANVISSAITNKPPPPAVANFLARRNRIHHLDTDTDETLLALFDHDPRRINRIAASNHVTLPSRNFAILQEHAPPVSAEADAPVAVLEHETSSPAARYLGNNGYSPLHLGEDGAGSEYPCADGLSAGVLVGGLDITIRVEVEPGNVDGNSQGYGFSVPRLWPPQPGQDGADRPTAYTAPNINDLIPEQPDEIDRAAEEPNGAHTTRQTHTATNGETNGS